MKQNTQDEIYIQMKNLLTECKKDILVSFLNKQIKEQQDLIRVLEDDMTLDMDMIIIYFQKKSKKEKAIIKMIALS